MVYDSSYAAADDDRQTIFALGELINATRDLADALRDTARDLHRDEDLSVPARSLLLELRKSGPLTVPALARRRELSRQFVQTTVNPLLAGGILAAQPNPAHRRSPLLVLTAAGTELIRQVMRREGALMHGLAADLTPAELRQAADTLTRLQEAVERRRAAE